VVVPRLMRLMAGFSPHSPGSDHRPGACWDLRYTKWHCDRFFSQYFHFSLSESFHQCPITYSFIYHRRHNTRTRARACRGDKTPGTRSLRRLNFVRLRLISVDPEYGTCFTSPFRQEIILRWRLDFWKIWVLLNTYVINISSWQQCEGSHFVQYSNLHTASCDSFKFHVVLVHFIRSSFIYPKLSIPQNTQHSVTARYELWTGFEKWNKPLLA